MEQGHTSSVARQAVRHRNILGAACLALIAIVLVQELRLYRRDTTTVVVPSEVTEPMRVRGGWASREYLEAMVADVVTVIYSVTPATADDVQMRILKFVHPSAYGAVKMQIQRIMTEVKQRGISTVFYIGSIDIDETHLTATVLGVLDTFIGKQRVSSVKKTIHMGLNYTAGHLSLISLSSDD